VKLTSAPEAGAPALAAVAVIGTVVGGVKLAPETEAMTVNEGGVTTVAFTTPKPLAVVLDALRFTGYVPAGVPLGALLPKVTEADCPGLSVTEEEESVVLHPDGSLDPRLIMLGEQPEESLFVTATE
jgi:hypothetical protein